MKRCSLCSRLLPVSSFYSRAGGHSLRGDCKDCCAKRRRAQYWSDPQRGRDAANEWASANREKARVRAAAWYRKNKTRALEGNRRYRAANADKVKKTRALYRDTNRDRILAQCAIYRASVPREKKALWSRTYRNKNRKKIAAVIKARRMANHDKYLAMEADVRKRHKKRIAENRREFRKRRIDGLHDKYIMFVIAQNLGVHQSEVVASPALIAAKREQLLLHRTLTNLKGVLGNAKE